MFVQPLTRRVMDLGKVTSYQKVVTIIEIIYKRYLHIALRCSTNDLHKKNEIWRVLPLDGACLQINQFFSSCL